MNKKEEKENKMNRYQNSKIYKLCVDNEPWFYIGSTCNKLSKRLGHHKENARKEPTRKVYDCLNKIGWDKVKIILIQDLKLESIEQLRREEDKEIRKYIDDPFCLNSRNAFNTDEDNIKLRKRLQYNRYWNNYEEELKRSNDYYSNNNSKIKCLCGCEVVKTQLIRHQKTKKHHKRIKKHEVCHIDSSVNEL